MSTRDGHEVTRLLRELGDGRAGAAERLAPLVYDELHLLAVRAMRRERDDHTLQPTALLHEAFLRLVGQHDVEWQSRAHFYGVAATAMRRILVDHARRRAAAKRQGGVRVTLDDSVDGALAERSDHAAERTLDVIALDGALERLAAVDPRQARMVELRFFAGLELEETARALDVSVATVKRDWTFARAFLARALGEGAPAGSAARPA